MATHIKVVKALRLVVRRSLPRPADRGDEVLERRGFLALTGLVLHWPSIAVRAQPDAKTRRISLLEAGASSANQHFVDAFMAGMHELGYVPGKNVFVDVRWAGGRVEGFRRGLDELIGLRPDVIVVSSTLGAVEAKRATTSIPVNFIGVPDPEGNGLVTSLARPGGNVTGLARTAGEGLTQRLFSCSGNWFPVLPVWPSFGTPEPLPRNAAGTWCPQRNSSESRRWSSRCATAMA